MKDPWHVHPDYAHGQVYVYTKTRRKRHKVRHHIAITVAIAAVTLAHFLLPHDLKDWSPIFGFIANLIWIWSD